MMVFPITWSSPATPTTACSSSSSLRGVHGAGESRGHEPRHGPRSGGACARPAGPSSSLASSCQLQVSALAHEDAPVVQHHARVQEGKVAEQVSDLALATGVGAVDNLEMNKTLLHSGSHNLYVETKLP